MRKQNNMISCSILISLLFVLTATSVQAENIAVLPLPILSPQEDLTKAPPPPTQLPASLPVAPPPAQILPVAEPAQPLTQLPTAAAQPIANLPVPLPASPSPQAAILPQAPQTTPPSLPTPAQPPATLPSQPSPQTTPSLPAPSQITLPPAVQPLATPAPLVDLEATINDPSEEKNIYLNFENTELFSFIDYIAELKKLNIIPDKALDGSKISLTIREPLSIEGAWNVFLTVLEMAGFSIIETGPVHKIVPKDKKLLQPLPAFINTPYTELPDSDLTIRYVIILSNIQVADIKPLLESMLSTPSSLLDQKEMNAFIITDKSYNVKAAAKLITELDQMGLPETVTVLRLKRANAVDVKTLFDALVRKQDSNPIARLLGKVTEGSTEYFSPTTRIIPEERTNSLILMGNNDSVQKIIDFVTENIDTELKATESPLHIYELQYIDARQVADILKEVTTTQLESSTGQAAAKYGSIRGGVKYFRDMKFQVDKDGNRLIVSCIDKQDWKLLKKTLDDLDKPQPQVGIETLIVSVNANDIKKLGGGVRNKKHGQIGKNIDAQSASIKTTGPSLEAGVGDGQVGASLLGNMLSQLTANLGQTVLTFGVNDPTKSNIWGIFQMLQTKTNASILSQPFVTVTNKTTAVVDVGEIRRIIDSQSGSGPGALQGFKDAPVSTKLDITPQINLDGLIRLKIILTISEFANSEGTHTTTKTVDTNVSVADGQVLILGGFIKTKTTESKNKTPILADIPLLGWFFKQQERTIEKEYVFVFLAPTIIKPRKIPGMQLYTKMKLHQATEDIEEAIETKRTLDPVHNWFFNAEKENYSHKVIDFANARYQPTTVDIRHDPYYRSSVEPEVPILFQDSVEPQPIAPQNATAQSDDLISQPEHQEQALPTAPQDVLPLMPIITDTHGEDSELDDKRKKLRELLAPEANTPPTPSLEVPSENLRSNLKELLMPEAPQAPAPTSNVTVGYHQRNNLKQFLGAHQALAHNVNRKPLRTRKMGV